MIDETHLFWGGLRICLFAILGRALKTRDDFFGIGKELTNITSMDVHDKATRSCNMSKIKSRDTRPEIMLRKFLFANGYRYTLHDKSLQGKPDIVLKRHKTIIDVRGCFWHSHKNCKYGDQVATSSSVVSEKRSTAVLRDEKNIQQWKNEDWEVLIELTYGARKFE